MKWKEAVREKMEAAGTLPSAFFVCDTCYDNQIWCSGGSSCTGCSLLFLTNLNHTCTYTAQHKYQSCLPPFEDKLYPGEVARLAETYCEPSLLASKREQQEKTREGEHSSNDDDPGKDDNTEMSENGAESKSINGKQTQEPREQK